MTRTSIELITHHDLIDGFDGAYRPPAEIFLPESRKGLCNRYQDDRLVVHHVAVLPTRNVLHPAIVLVCSRAGSEVQCDAESDAPSRPR